eukprot:TRINITY_DN23534_c0_g1_i1.p1 TRINITY_DN23534_c0_g1~~TRINITY_DN23534_c0_g1_i1.p1  ORF type:complete len:1175 (+),score=200.14 TRINITY_DN23534_c0_g1_i1:265-3525(+)
MREAEGEWVGGASTKFQTRDLRRDLPFPVISHARMTPIFPAHHRLILFAPEFGSDKSFDADSWSYLEPEDHVDLYVVCWQGWEDFSTMIEQLLPEVMSIADGINTVWFGQGMGAIVAFELLKLLEVRSIKHPNLPSAFVVSDCPAPHLFSSSYRPYNQAGWSDQLASHSPESQKIITEGVSLMTSYNFKYHSNMRLLIPVVACFHDGEALASASAVSAWKEYAKEGHFRTECLGDAEPHQWYLEGRGAAEEPEPDLLAIVTNAFTTYDRRANEDAWPDIGPTDGSIPEVVGHVIIGCGIAGIYQAKTYGETGKDFIMFDRYHAIGGVWEFYGNDHSRVNTSEIGYRVVEQQGPWARVNEDHTPRQDIMRDLHWLVNRYAYGKVRCNIEVTKVEKQSDDTYIVSVKSTKTGVEHRIHTTSVSFQVNRRIGKKRIVDHEGQDMFKGHICYGVGNESKNLDLWNKRVLIVGAGAFAFENVRTAVEKGCRHVTLLGRRDGTTCPKWIDMIAFLRPLDKYFQTNKAGNMISFECWQKLYIDAGLKTPSCWAQGLLKPHNHTISVSDLAYIGGFHGLVDLKCGEIARYRPDGKGVELKDGSTLDADIVIKCTGFLLNDEVPVITGTEKMHPYGLIDFNMNYQAEPLLDQGQFGSARSADEAHESAAVAETAELTKTPEFAKGLEVFKRIGGNPRMFMPQGNPFGSGQGGPIDFLSLYFTYLIDHPEEQKALLSLSGAPPQEMVKLWATHMGQNTVLTAVRLIRELAKYSDVALADAAPEGTADKRRVALLFPGPGSQYAGMLSKLRGNAKVKEMADAGKEILGYDLLEICINGPEEKLEDTSICEPAMFFAGMAAIEQLRELHPAAVNNPGAVAGLASGEFTALCAAGVLSFEDCLEVVKVRALACSKAANLQPQAMLSVAGLDQRVLERLCAEQAKDGEICRISNVLFKKGFTCAGTKEAIERLKEKAEENGALQARIIKPSGGFYTELMKPAQEEVDHILRKKFPRMKPPICDIYMNATGQSISAGSSAINLLPLLTRQLCSPVLWEPSVRAMLKDGLEEFYEVGPGKQLKAMMKRIDQSAWNNTTSLEA